MLESSRYKLVVFVPESHAEKVKAALFAAGAGRDGGYEHCCWQVKGLGQFRPLKGSQPFIGSEGGLEQVIEERLEMFCPAQELPGILQALIKAHPYEVPAYEVYPVWQKEDFA